MIKIDLPEDARMILNVLHSSGYEAYVVGGYVRDYVINYIYKGMDLTTHDIDFTTNANSEQITELFENLIKQGILKSSNVITEYSKYGCIGIVVNDVVYDVVSYRSDGNYEDYRRPQDVKFVGTLKEDLSRRDFTINAMAYNEEEGLVDYFNGVDDIKGRLIRCVGEAKGRFTEDALRMLRAIRFASKLQFRIHGDIIDAIKALKSNLTFISHERITKEFTSILCSKGNGMYYLYKTGIIDEILPWISYEEYYYMSKCKRLEYSEDYLAYNLFVLFNNYYYNIVLLNSILKENLRYSNEIVSLVCNSIRDESRVVTVINFINQYKGLNVNKDIVMKNVNLLMTNVSVESINIILKYYSYDKVYSKSVEIISEAIKNIISNNIPYRIDQLAINGCDIMTKCNLSPSKRVGDILELLLGRVVYGLVENDRKALLSDCEENFCKSLKVLDK